MSIKEKELLVSDLCGRLAYGVNVRWYGEYELVKLYRVKLYGKSLDDYVFSGLGQPEPGYEYDMRITDIKPYLRPLSSMTKDENIEINCLNLNEDGRCQCSYERLGEYIMNMHPALDNEVYISDTAKVIDWMNRHHFDYRRLIDKGLALIAPEDMYK